MKTFRTLSGVPFILLAAFAFLNTATAPGRAQEGPGRTQEDPCAKYGGKNRHIVCCPLACEHCGGHDCGSSTPGGSQCCTHRIVKSGVICTSNGPLPCILLDEPDMFLKLEGDGDAKTLTVSENPDNRSGLRLENHGDIALHTNSIGSILFGRSADSKPFTWVGMRFGSSLCSEDEPCPKSVFEGAWLLDQADASGKFLPKLTGTQETGLLTLIDDNTIHPETSSCYQIAVLDSSGNQIDTDPKIYNKRATEPCGPAEPEDGPPPSEPGDEDPAPSTTR